MNHHDVIVRPIITEKNTMLGAQGKYIFEVAKSATKPMISAAVKAVFDRDVVSVNIIHVPGKNRRVGRRRILTSPWKKAVVSLKTGQRIELFESA